MSVIADVAFGAAPIAGGVLMGVLAGTIKGPDYRGMIKDDLELLEKIPPEDVELRAALKSSIDVRIADLVVSTERTRQLRDAASSYKGNWRDGVLFFCSVLFTIVWWNVPHLIISGNVIAVHFSKKYRLKEIRTHIVSLR